MFLKPPQFSHLWLNVTIAPRVIRNLKLFSVKNSENTVEQISTELQKSINISSTIFDDNAGVFNPTQPPIIARSSIIPQKSSSSQVKSSSSYTGGYPFEISKVIKTSRVDKNRPTSRGFESSSPDIQPASLYYHDESPDPFSPA